LVQLFIQQAACTFIQQAACTSNERVASAQKRGSAGHLSSGAKGHFSTAGIRLSWIGDDFETDFSDLFWRIFGLHFEHNLAWTCSSLKESAPWIQVLKSQLAKRTISKSD
jgi:hypothetical protein